MFQVIPAVDLMNGKVVRLYRGDPKHVSSYEHLGDPIIIAQKWQDEGAEKIHIVDLDGALGRGNNFQTIKQIINAVKIPIQVGGGIREIKIAKAFISFGVNRIIIGSGAFNPIFFNKLLKNVYKERIIVALDNLNGLVMIKGWRDSTNLTLKNAILKFSNLGIKNFLITSVLQDGTLEGPDLQTIKDIYRKDIELIVAGGIKDLQDIMALKKIGINAAIIGKALYEGKINLRELIKKIKNNCRNDKLC